MDAGLKAYRTSGARLFAPYGLALKAHALLKFSRTREAQVLLSDALAEASELECHFVRPQIMHLLATCAVQSTTPNAAQAFDTAFSEAVKTGAGQIARTILSEGVKAKIWTPQEIASLTARLQSTLAEQIR